MNDAKNFINPWTSRLETLSETALNKNNTSRILLRKRNITQIYNFNNIISDVSNTNDQNDFNNSDLENVNGTEEETRKCKHPGIQNNDEPEAKKHRESEDGNDRENDDKTVSNDKVYNPGMERPDSNTEQSLDEQNSDNNTFVTNSKTDFDKLLETESYNISNRLKKIKSHVACTQNVPQSIENVILETVNIKNRSNLIPISLNTLKCSSQPSVSTSEVIILSDDDDNKSKNNHKPINHKAHFTRTKKCNEKNKIEHVLNANNNIDTTLPSNDNKDLNEEAQITINLDQEDKQNVKNSKDKNTVSTNLNHFSESIDSFLKHTKETQVQQNNALHQGVQAIVNVPSLKVIELEKIKQLTTCSEGKNSENGKKSTKSFQEVSVQTENKEPKSFQEVSVQTENLDQDLQLTQNSIAQKPFHELYNFNNLAFRNKNLPENINSYILRVQQYTEIFAQQYATRLVFDQVVKNMYHELSSGQVNLDEILNFMEPSFKKYFLESYHRLNVGQNVQTNKEITVSNPPIVQSRNVAQNISQQNNALHQEIQAIVNVPTLKAIEREKTEVLPTCSKRTNLENGKKSLSFQEVTVKTENESSLHQDQQLTQNSAIAQNPLYDLNHFNTFMLKHKNVESENVNSYILQVQQYRQIFAQQYVTELVFDQVVKNLYDKLSSGQVNLNDLLNIMEPAFRKLFMESFHRLNVGQNVRTNNEIIVCNPPIVQSQNVAENKPNTEQSSSEIKPLMSIVVNKPIDFKVENDYKISPIEPIVTLDNIKKQEPMDVAEIAPPSPPKTTLPAPAHKSKYWFISTMAKPKNLVKIPGKPRINPEYFKSIIGPQMAIKIVDSNDFNRTFEVDEVIDIESKISDALTEFLSEFKHPKAPTINGMVYIEKFVWVSGDGYLEEFLTKALAKWSLSIQTYPDVSPSRPFKFFLKSKMKIKHIYKELAINNPFIVEDQWIVQLLEKSNMCLCFLSSQEAVENLKKRDYKITFLDDTLVLRPGSNMRKKKPFNKEDIYIQFKKFPDSSSKDLFVQEFWEKCPIEPKVPIVNCEEFKMPESWFIFGFTKPKNLVKIPGNTRINPDSFQYLPTNPERVVKIVDIENRDRTFDISEVIDIEQKLELELKNMTIKQVINGWVYMDNFLWISGPVCTRKWLSKILPRWKLTFLSYPEVQLTTKFTFTPANGHWPAKTVYQELAKNNDFVLNDNWFINVTKRVCHCYLNSLEAVKNLEESDFKVKYFGKEITLKRNDFKENPKKALTKKNKKKNINKKNNGKNK